MLGKPLGLICLISKCPICNKKEGAVPELIWKPYKYFPSTRVLNSAAISYPWLHLHLIQCSSHYSSKARRKCFQQQSAIRVTARKLHHLEIVFPSVMCLNYSRKEVASSEKFNYNLTPPTTFQQLSFLLT